MEKMIVLDLDGTLLRDDKTVSNEAIETLLKFKSIGNKILFATARPPRDAYKYVPEILRDNPIICYNGACIINGKDILYKKEMERDVVLDILKISKELGYQNICFEINDKLYSNFDTSKFFNDNEYEAVDLETYPFETCYKVLICSKEKISQQLLKELPHNAKGVITDNGSLCQIMNKDASKWNCIKALAKQYGIDVQNIIAFGNDYNDLEMIKNAGIGVAMGNSEQDIKKVANVVTDTNMNDGVEKYIKDELLI